MNLRQLECFYAVADELHFGRASATLHLSQASVSQAVAQLERRLGGQLLRRTTRRVQVTAFGAEFLAATRPHYEQLLAAYTLARVRGQADDEVVVAHTPELGHLLLPGLVATGTGTDEAPDLPDWRPLVLHTHAQIRAAADGRVDIGLCWVPSVTAPVTVTVLTRCPFAVVLPEGDPLADRNQLRLPDLHGRKIVVSSRQDNLFIDSRMQAALLQSGLASSNLDEVGSYDELALRVASRKQVGIHPATVALLNRVPGVAFRLLDEPGLMLDVCAIHLSEPGDGVRRLIRELQQVSERVMGDVLGSLSGPPNPTGP